MSKNKVQFQIGYSLLEFIQKLWNRTAMCRSPV